MMRATSDLPPVAILGIGAVTCLGRGMDAQLAGLSAPPPTNLLAYRVDDTILNAKEISRSMRRGDRFSKMAVLAAMDAHQQAQSIHADQPQGTAVIVATGLGPHARTFRFLDGILDHGDKAALPTDFSHSVHNAVSGYITQFLGIQGRSSTFTQFRGAFAQAIELAQCWLHAGNCTRVLVGMVDELGEVALHLAGRMGAKPLPVGEGAIFVELGLISDTFPDALQISTTHNSESHCNTANPWFGLTACPEAFELIVAKLKLEDDLQSNKASDHTFNTTTSTNEPFNHLTIPVPDFHLCLHLSKHQS